MKKILSVLTILLTFLQTFSAADTFDNGILSIDKVLVDDDIYSNVKVTISELIQNNGGIARANFDTYDGSTGHLTIPRVEVGNEIYTNLVVSLDQALSFESVTSSRSLPTKTAVLDTYTSKDCIDNLSDDIIVGFELKHMMATVTDWGCNITNDSTKNPTASGESALRFELRPDDCTTHIGGYNDCTNDRNRFEVYEPYPGEADVGKTVTYGHKFFLPKQDFYPYGLPITIFSQVASQGNNLHPLLYLHTDDGRNLKIRIHQGWTFSFIDYTISDNLFDTWHDIRYELTGGIDNNNTIKVYLSNELVVDVKRNTFRDSSGFFELKLGIYQAFLSRSSSIPTSLVVYHDEIYKSYGE